ncbi:SDR family oxidoreductase [Novosphingobium album (ex Liu et al. 2023)]|uniref:SDR family NAD(P)-dependent oxidoreductase n=1 Tax=Novosphingobium album (ex Liu et al. 2023) TaxID=3031130 RepID=A0ABT5WM36_9SPHN|nr:SDR family oxidoreductase [Novosphingobium album (ex Liu et al. 2023)]MDE8651110.1 SDR family NAD(P)-dependent oxidoreductase [Novosphingobium album (ex Liu et al. 2023)]
MELSEARHAFITGGASGLGLGIAQAMARRGIAVTIADINEEALAEVIAANDDRWHGALLDTRDREGWKRVKAGAEAAFGPVDILVNNAGIAPNGQQFADMDPESFDRIIAINLVGIANGVFAFAAEMRDRGRGHIVNTSSQAGLTASVPGVGAYAVAKFGVTALSEGLRKELAPHGVGVSALCPGYVTTNLAQNTVRIGGQVRQSPMAIPQSAITPGQVGEMVAEGIARNDAYIITHPDAWPSVEKRMNAIHAACLARETA